MTDVKSVQGVRSEHVEERVLADADADRRWWSRRWGRGRGADREAQWSPQSMASRRHCDVMEPPSRRAVALLSAARMSTLR